MKLFDYLRLPTLSPQKIWQLYNLSLGLITLNAYLEGYDMPELSIALYFAEGIFPNTSDFAALALHTLRCYQARNGMNNPDNPLLARAGNAADMTNQAAALSLRSLHLARKAITSLSEAINDYRQPETDLTPSLAP
jgi:hypothetical protein